LKGPNQPASPKRNKLKEKEISKKVKKLIGRK
jgi:hypothetical protein